MKKNILLPALLSVLAVTSCQNKNTTDSEADNMMVIELKQVELDEMNTFDNNLFFDSVKYVILEATPQSIFSEINDVFFVEQMIIIVSKKEGAILFFDEEGNYLRKISHRGKARYEYNSIHRVMLDEAKRELMVYDRDTKKINRYTLEGKYIDTITGLQQFDDIINLPDGGFLCYNHFYMPVWESNRTGLWKIDSNGEFAYFLHQIDDYHGELFLVNGHFVFQHPTANGKIGFMDLAYGTTIYETTGEELTRTAQFKFDIRTRADYKGTKESIINKELIWPRSYQEKGDFVFTQWNRIGSMATSVVFSKVDKSLFYSNFNSEFMKGYLILGTSDYVRNNHPNRMTVGVEPTFIPATIHQLIDSPEKRSMNYIMNRNIDFRSANPVLQINYVKHSSGK